jgi:hypothetical protein
MQDSISQVSIQVWIGVGAALITLLIMLGYFATRDRRAPAASSGPGFGLVLCFLGLAGAAYFLMFFDVSVSFNGQRLDNLDLMNQRQNGVIVSMGLFVGGVLISMLGSRRS